MNFHGGLDREAFEQHARPRDITLLEPDEIVAQLGLGAVEDAFDVVVGGPPCQAYALRRSRENEGGCRSSAAFKVDPRGIFTCGTCTTCGPLSRSQS